MPLSSNSSCCTFFSFFPLSFLPSARIEEFKSTFYASYNWFFLVFTNDTFDRILPEKVFTQVTYLAVFFPSVYIGQRFLLSLIIGDTYDTFRGFVKKQVKNERLKEIKGLTKAFAAIDDFKVKSPSSLSLPPSSFLPSSFAEAFFSLWFGSKESSPS